MNVIDNFSYHNLKRITIPTGYEPATNRVISAIPIWYQLLMNVE